MLARCPMCGRQAIADKDGNLREHGPKYARCGGAPKPKEGLAADLARDPDPNARLVLADLYEERGEHLLAQLLRAGSRLVSALTSGAVSKDVHHSLVSSLGTLVNGRLHAYVELFIGNTKRLSVVAARPGAITIRSDAPAQIDPDYKPLVRLPISVRVRDDVSFRRQPSRIVVLRGDARIMVSTVDHCDVIPGGDGFRPLVRFEGLLVTDSLHPALMVPDVKINPSAAKYARPA